MRILQQIKTKKFSKLTVEVAICHKAYDQTGLKASTRTREGQTTKIATMPEPLMCLVGRCVLSRHNQMETTEKLMAAKGKKIEPDGTMFLTLTLGHATSKKTNTTRKPSIQDFFY